MYEHGIGILQSQVNSGAIILSSLSKTNNPWFFSRWALWQDKQGSKVAQGLCNGLAKLFLELHSVSEASMQPYFFPQEVRHTL